MKAKLEKLSAQTIPGPQQVDSSQVPVLINIAFQEVTFFTICENGNLESGYILMRPQH